MLPAILGAATHFICLFLLRLVNKSNQWSRHKCFAFCMPNQRQLFPSLSAIRSKCMFYDYDDVVDLFYVWPTKGTWAHHYGNDNVEVTKQIKSLMSLDFACTYVVIFSHFVAVHSGSVCKTRQQLEMIISSLGISDNVFGIDRWLTYLVWAGFQTDRHTELDLVNSNIKFKKKKIHNTVVNKYCRLKLFKPKLNFFWLPTTTSHS